MFSFFSNLLVLISVVLPVLYMLRVKKSGKPYKLFTIYLVFIGFIQTVMAIYAHHKWNNLFMSHFYFIGQFILFSLFYKALLKKQWILWVLAVVLAGLAIQYALQPSIVFIFNSYGMSLTQTILVLYAFLYFYKSLGTEGSFLFINAGILFYLITSVLYFASYNLFLELQIDNQYSDSIFWLHQFLYFIFQILIFVEWYRKYRVRESRN